MAHKHDPTPVRAARTISRARALGLTTVMVVPPAVRGHVIGALGLGTTLLSTRRYRRRALLLARDFAQRVALAVDSALRHDAARCELAQMRSRLAASRHHLPDHAAQRARAVGHRTIRQRTPFIEETVMHRILLIEPADRHESLRDVLEAAGGEVMLARVARSALAWPLSRPALIVLHGFATDRTADLLAQLRCVGVDMPALVVTTEHPANGRLGLETAGRASESGWPARFVIEVDLLRPVQLGAALARIAQAIADSAASQTRATSAGESVDPAQPGTPVDVGGTPVATPAALTHRRRRGARRGPQAA